MTLRLADIGVRVDPGYGLGGGVTAVLHEIATRLERLADTGEFDIIDLRSLPLSPADRDRLQSVLGTGEVEATVKIDGESKVRETGIAGVWWIEHRDADGVVIADLLEIARVPEILNVAQDELGRGAAALRARIARGGNQAIQEAP